ncbi:MAG: SDR family NAD(P)-dependent oxidoreductase [Gammaproteobacteria bacterium]|nr:SDR family NAD(P)-dependent oxidoreductase [Gammaproteobacteria bacterium]
MRLKHKVAVVTGASNGIGLAICERYLAEGVKLVMSDIDAEKGAAEAERLGSAGDVIFIQCDVGDKASVDLLFSKAAHHYGRVDIAVANAGILRTGTFIDVREEDFDAVIRVNLKGVFLTGQAAARQMSTQDPQGGTIINMSSTNQVLAIPQIASYVVSKGGVGQLTKVMAISLVEQNIRVNGIGPGSVATEMFEKNIATNASALAEVMSRTPMKRPADPGEIASIAVFLASQDSSYITGQTIFADGGRLPLAYTC